MARRRSAPAPRRAAPARQPARQPTQPAVAQQNAVQPQQPIVVQKQPGMMANIATTALGVAGGHMIANAVTGAMSGGGSHPQEQQQQQPQQYAQQPQQQYNQQMNPCQLEMEQFFNCTQSQFDLSMCENLNAALKECKMRFSNQM